MGGDMTVGGLMISAPASGAGKTTVTLGLARAFRNRGLAVQCFKSGPDYIDPGFHATASGRPSYNLDTWAMPGALLEQVAAAGRGADVILAEGSLGLHDGAATPGASGTGASAETAAAFGWPVVLVLDPAGQSQTAAAVARGLATFRPDVEVAGVILNRIASPRHEALVRAGMDSAGIRVFGVLPRSGDIRMPERHLGLVQACEQQDIDQRIDAAAALMARHVDLDGLLRVAGGNPASNAPALAIRPPAGRIALARDAAFSFIYPHLIEAWRNGGATILPFSPLADEAPDRSAELCWLPGGYPELHAGRLSNARRFLDGLRDFAKTRPVHGECGGYMVMGACLTDAGGRRHAMAGLLGMESSFAQRKMHLGYRHATLLSSTLGFAAGARLRGHEFHYASLVRQPDEALAAIVDATGAPVAETGSRRGLATGTFFHVIAEAA